jgi:hypothetical protein
VAILIDLNFYENNIGSSTIPPEPLLLAHRRQGKTRLPRPENGYFFPLPATYIYRQEFSPLPSLFFTGKPPGRLAVSSLEPFPPHAWLPPLKYADQSVCNLLPQQAVASKNKISLVFNCLQRS